MYQPNVSTYLTPQEAETFRKYYGQSNLPETTTQNNQNYISPDSAVYVGSYSYQPQPHLNPELTYGHQPNQITHNPNDLQIYPPPQHYAEINNPVAPNQYGSYVLAPSAQTHHALNQYSHQENQHIAQLQENPIPGHIQHGSNFNNHEPRNEAQGNNVGDSIQGNLVDQIPTYLISNDQPSNNQAPLSPDEITLLPNVTLNEDPERPQPQTLKPLADISNRKPTYWERLKEGHRVASKGDMPSLTRFILRCIQLIGAIIALLLTIFCHTEYPEKMENNKATIYYFYFPVIISIIVGLFHLVDYYQRRFQYRSKFPRIFYLSFDLFAFIMLFCGILPLAFQFNPCTIGSEGGWCDIRNSLLAFSSIVGSIYLVHIIWSLFANCCSTPRNN